MKNVNKAANSIAKVAKAASAAMPQTPTPAAAPVAPIAVARANVAAKAANGVGVTLHTNGAPIKGLAAQPAIAKPTAKMLQTIASIKGHPGKGNCVKRFHLYKVGMTLQHCKVTEGLIPSDVTFYASLGYLTLRPCTAAELAAAVAAWQASQPKPVAVAA